MLFSSFNETNLKQRIVSSSVLVPVALMAVYAGGYFYALFVIAAAIAGVFEWMHMMVPKADSYTKTLPAILVMVALGFAQTRSFALGIVFIILSSFIVFTAVSRKDVKKRLGVAWIVAGLPYVTFCGVSLLYLRNIEEVGRTLTFFLMLSVWATDIGAFIAGRLIGGPKLLPEVSPNKTWAGLIGGAMAAAVTGGVFISVSYPGNTVTFSLIAVLLAIVSQAGDLFESYVKRRSGVKDSGNLIPGHGGVLDRIDGLIFASVFFAAFSIVWG